MRARSLTAALVLTALALLAAPVARATPPDWPAPNPALYEGSLGVTAVLVVGGQERTASGDRMAAFIDGRLCGVAAPISVGGRNVYFLTVYGNAADVGSTVTFQAYDAATDATLNGALQTATGAAAPLLFAFNAQLGTVNNPYRVAADAQGGPSWPPPNPAQYEGYASVTGAVSLDAAALNTPGVRVAAYVGGQLRGVATASATVVNGRRLFFLSVYANLTELAQTVRFQVYDPITGVVYPAAATVAVGASGQYGTYGSATNPFDLSVSTNATYTTTLNSGEGWYGIATPVTGVTIGGLLGSAWTQGFPGADADPTNTLGWPNVIYYAEGTSTPTQHGFLPPPAGPGGSASPAVPGVGYFAYVYADDDPTVAGVQGGFPKMLAVAGAPPPFPYTFAVQRTVTPGGPEPTDGWNLLGNPAPTSIDWDAAGWKRRNVAPSVWTWDTVAHAYRVWSATLGIGDLEGGVVPAFSSFWVRAMSANPSLTATASVQAGGAAATTTAGTSPPTGVLQFRIEALSGPLAGRSANAFIALAEGAALGVDSLDAAAIPPLDAQYLSLHTQPPMGGGARLQIQALPPALTASVTLPLGANCITDGTGSYRLSWPRVELPMGYTATLIDLQTGATLGLGTATAYAFESGQTWGRPDRFALRLDPAFVTDTEGGTGLVLALDTPAPNPAATTTTLRFTLPATGTATLTVYDALGRQVAVLADGTLPAGAHEAPLDATRLAPGIYTVRLSSSAGAVVQRLAVVR